ncbi:MAG: phosphatidate cytidylyltransferase [Chlamydiae bacterium]|nr:phosphatidate cytidylyltransferase [Chlamydiota bacterium]MBI3265770.1 phosphatidate cytidylyltransferase [Chlamydiota bacterium]
MFSQRFFTSCFLILAMLGIVFFAPWPLFLVIGLILVVLGEWEFYRMMDEKVLHPLLFFGIFAGVVLFSVQFLCALAPRLDSQFHLEGLTSFLIILGTFGVVLSRFGRVAVIACISTTLLGIFYVSGLSSFLVKIRYFPQGNGAWLLLFLILVTKATDIFAYLVGSWIGKRKWVPQISPKKTLEGALAGVLGAILIASLLYFFARHFFYPLEWKDVLCLGTLLGFFSQVGDVMESALKRDAGRKDSGSLLPGMGGVLDLMDSLLVTGPIMYFWMVI